MRTALIWITLAIGSLLVWLAPSTSWARQPTEEELVRARAYFEDGAKAANANQWDKAFEALSECWKLKQHPQVAANLGKASLKVQRPGLAAEMFYYYLRESPQISEADKKATDAMLAEARSKSTAVIVDVSEPKAVIFVDDLPMGVSPLTGPIYMDFGAHVVSARNAAGKVVRKTIEVVRSRETRVVLDFAEKSAVAASTAATQGPTATERTDDAAEPNGAVLVAGIGAFAVGVGLGVTGVVLSNGAKADMDEISKQESKALRPRWEDADDDRVFWGNLAEGAFIGAGVAALATVGYVVLVGGDGAAKKDTAAVTAVDVQVSAERSTIVLTQRW